ncbi:MAG: hypothetical protein LAT50_02490 [Ectothiorhodospiraceae bacterium]|nr:hypothetical protein [Ectothiorhodospiraceae bacterium]
MRHVLAAAAIIAVLSGCATQQRHAEIMDSWLGEDINDLVASWGYPSGDFRAPNGNKVYVYENTVTGQVPTIVQHGPTTVTGYGNTATIQQGPSVVYGGGTRTNWCRMHFETSDSGRIQAWRSEGNSCKSR